jgi:hypothetical protein
MMKKLVLLCMLSALSVGWIAPSAHALTQFRKAFQEKYVDKGRPELQAEFKKASCNTCHLKGKNKKERNPYGDELSKLIEGDANQRIKDAGAAKQEETAKILAELEKAFAEVAKMKSPTGESFGDRIGAGKLPFDQ